MLLCGFMRKRIRNSGSENLVQAYALFLHRSLLAELGTSSETRAINRSLLSELKFGLAMIRMR
jgi:hypothetical protein